jgi:hypothetical protein
MIILIVMLYLWKDLVSQSLISFITRVRVPAVKKSTMKKKTAPIECKSGYPAPSIVPIAQ